MQVTKIDLRKELRPYLRPRPDEAEFVTLPKWKFLVIDGKGDPQRSDFQSAVQLLYGVSYTLKFQIKRIDGIDYPVSPLEGLWWMKGGGFDMAKREEWLWSLMIMQPNIITARHFARAASELKEKKGLETTKCRFEPFEEGKSAQILHVGPYSAEGPTIQRLDEFIRVNGYRMSGKHHEIYLGDPRRSAPTKLKTILRHPVRRA